MTALASALEAYLPSGFQIGGIVLFDVHGQVGASVLNVKTRRFVSSRTPIASSPQEMARALVEQGIPYPLSRAWQQESA